MTGWHLGDDAVRRYVERADSVAEGASAEQHLLCCGRCRGRVSAVAGVIDLAAVWDRTRDAYLLLRGRPPQTEPAEQATS